jgi:hypothetical protein
MEMSIDSICELRGAWVLSRTKKEIGFRFMGPNAGAQDTIQNAGSISSDLPMVSLVERIQSCLNIWKDCIPAPMV